MKGGLPLEFPVVTPQVVGPSAEPSIDFPLKVMNIYKTNLICGMVRFNERRAANFSRRHWRRARESNPVD